MRIAYCIPSLFNSGGMERVLTEKANYLAETLKVEVYVITTSQNGKSFFYNLSPMVRWIDLEINYDNINGNLFSQLWRRWRKKSLHKRRLAILLSEIKADIVISMYTHEMTFLPNIKDGSRKILEYHFSKEMSKLKISAEYSGLSRLLFRFSEWYNSRQIKYYDRFVLLTQRDAEAWGNLKNSCVIHNPVTIPATREASLQNQVVLAVGRLCYQKGFDLLLNIWKQVYQEFPDWKLEILGSGPAQESLSETIKQGGMAQSVVLLPPTKDPSVKYLNSGILVATSRYEGFHLAILEAQCLGVPAISYDTPCGPSDIIADGKSGFIIPMNQEELFAKRLKILMQDSTLRQRFGAYAATEVRNKFTLFSIMREWQLLFCDLLNTSEHDI